MDVAFVLRSWSEAHPEFVVGGNEAGMKLGGDVRAADVAVWRVNAATPRSGRIRTVPPVLAVEVSGEDEDEQVLRGKAHWYLEHGVSVVWLVFPDARRVLVLSAAGEKNLVAGQTLPPDEQLPNLKPAVAQLLAQLDR